MPAPKLFTSLPVESNFWIGARLEAEQSSAVAQRSNTHTLLPSRSMSTPTAAPHLRPSGSFAQPSSSRKLCGAELGSTAWAWPVQRDRRGDRCADRIFRYRLFHSALKPHDVFLPAVLPWD